MPYLNDHGEWVAGMGNGVVSWGGATPIIIWTEAGAADWLDNDTLIAQHCPGGVCSLKTHNVRTNAEASVSAAGANVVQAGGGVWARFLNAPGAGVATSLGLHLPDASLEHVGPDGAVCVKDSYQASGGPFTVHEADGSSWVLTTGLAVYPQLLGAQRAVWTEGGSPRTVGGVPVPMVLKEPYFWLRMVEMSDGWWVLYQDTNSNLLLHPVDSPMGYVVASGNTFVPDLMQLSAGVIRIVWSDAQGEMPSNIHTRDINVTTEDRVSLGVGVPPPPGGGTGTGGGPSGTGTTVLSSSGSFGVAGAAEELITLPIPVYPAFPAESGFGRIVHPTLGPFDYEVKPDEWVNIDADAIIAPIWASTRTLTSAANVLWQGNIRDVVVEERWKSLGGLAMPITQLRMLLAIWTTPIDPDVGYVHWYPNYITSVGFKVLPVNLSAGGQGIALDDVTNYKDEDGEPIGWVTSPVTFTLKLVERL